MMSFKRVALIFSFIALSPAAALAQAWPTIDTPAKEAYVIDESSGTVLFEKNAQERMPTSSMSKIMTAYLTFEAIKNGQLGMTQQLPVSERAWKMQGSKMFIPVGGQVAVEDLIRGMIIQSGNDACVALAEAVAGSEEVFARRMTEKAKEMGLANTNFANATGWPDPNHYSTAEDLAKLAMRLTEDFPEHYHYYSEKDFTYNGIKQGNRNPLLYNTNGADGMKTGHTDIAGYGLIGSAKRDGRRVILVVNGLNSMQQRADESRRLMEWAFSQFRTINIVDKGMMLDELPVWEGMAEKVGIVADHTVKFTLPYGVTPSAKIVAETPLAAPIAKGQKVANLVISVPGKEPVTYPLLAAADVPALGFWGRIEKKLGL